MAKKVFLSGVLVMLASCAVAQTKEATHTWIIEQTRMNPFRLKHSIEGDALISSTTMGSAAMGGETVEKAIPVSQVTTIAYTHTNEYLSYTLSCNAPCSYLMESPEIKRPKFLFEIYSKLDAGYVQRMNNALLHLVKLHGGQAKVVKAAVPKQPF